MSIFNTFNYLKIGPLWELNLLFYHRDRRFEIAKSTV